MFSIFQSSPIALILSECEAVAAVAKACGLPRRQSVANTRAVDRVCSPHLENKNDHCRRRVRTSIAAKANKAVGSLNFHKASCIVVTTGPSALGRPSNISRHLTIRQSLPSSIRLPERRRGDRSTAVRLPHRFFQLPHPSLCNAVRGQILFISTRPPPIRHSMTSSVDMMIVALLLLIGSIGVFSVSVPEDIIDLLQDTTKYNRHASPTQALGR